MIALLTTYFILAYVLVPGVLFRVFAGLWVHLRLFQLTRTQEITLGVLVSILPLCTANWFVWKIPIAEGHPFSYSFGGIDEYKRDYRLGLSLVVSSDPEKLLHPTEEPKSVYEQAISRIWRRQLRFLSWYFIFSLIEGSLFGFLASKYGDWTGKSVVYDWLARKVLLPNISEFQVLLTDFTWPKDPKRDVIADVLCQDTLYRGKVSDYFLDANGRLSGLFMTDAERFRREDFKLACLEAKVSGVKVDKEKFWREIPGSNFYIPADKLSNLNVHFPTEDPRKDKQFDAFLDDLLKALPAGTTASFDAEAQPPDSSENAPDADEAEPN
ncbi:MAG: hypothetical protein WCA10_09070 [Terracidiphilus sp.]